MNCRVKTLFGLVVLGIFASCFAIELTRADEINWDLLSSKMIAIEPFGSGQGEVLSSYPSFIQYLLTKIVSWDPRKEVLQSTNNELNNSSKPFILTQLMRNLSVQFEVTDAQYFRKVWFHLSPTLQVRGLFGIHDFKKARPLIILRMGIHGNVDELLAERFIAKAVYEDLDANFLILESLTSHAFIAKNKQFSFGGIEEGIHTLLILNELMDQTSKMKQLISEVHLIGVSLGGQGVFVTNWLDQLNGQKISSSLQFCPLINLSETFQYHSQKSLQNSLVDLWSSKRMEALLDHYADQFSKYNSWKSLFDFQPRFTPLVLKILNEERKQTLLSSTELKNLYPKLKWPESFMNLISKSKSFDELNNFWPFYKGDNLKMMIYTTPNDPLVINGLNSERLFLGKQPGFYKGLKYVRLDRGLHCGLATAYDWTSIVKMIKAGLDLK